MKYFAIIIFSLISIKLSAQQKQFSLNENGKYIYYEVADVMGVDKDSLMIRAKFFINKVYGRTLKQQSVTDTSVLAKGKMIIDKTVLIAGHPSGEVRYNLTFEARTGKYRFWLTDFEYIPYQRNRYGNYVATTNIGIPLEKSPTKLNIGEWKSTVDASYEKIEKLADDFKKVLKTSNVLQNPDKPKAVLNTKW